MAAAAAVGAGADEDDGDGGGGDGAADKKHQLCASYSAIHKKETDRFDHTAAEMLYFIPI